MSNFKTCKTCKSWGAYRVGCCDRIGDLQATKTSEKMFDFDVHVSDDTGLYVELRTGPDFGCVHHSDNS